MAKPKRPRDPNQLAKLIVDIATGVVHEPRVEESAMALRGRSGGLKGGNARAKKLTRKQRATIAKKAAVTRWKKSKT